MPEILQNILIGGVFVLPLILMVIFVNRWALKKAETIIKLMHDYYNEARTKFPNKKEIFYLALAWVIYAKKHHPEQYEEKSFYFLMVAVASGDTLIFSLLKSPDSIDALSYFMVHKERLGVSKKYEPKFNEIMKNTNLKQIQLATDQQQMEQATNEVVEYLSDEMKNFEGITEKDF